MSSAYAHADVERLLAYMFNGGQWRRPDAPGADMPRAAGNPARLGTEMAEAVDIRRAWLACLEDDALADPVALFGHYGCDDPSGALAEVLATPRQTVEWRIFRDVEVLTDAINRGHRPTRHLKELA